MSRLFLHLLMLLLFLSYSALLKAEVIIESPENGAIVGGTIPIVVSYQGTTNFPVYYVHCTPGGSYYPDHVLSGTHTFYWDTTGTQEGEPVIIEVTAMWAGYPSGSSDRITVTVNNPSPTITILNPQDGEFVLPPSASIKCNFHNNPPNDKGIKWINLAVDDNWQGGYYVPGEPTLGSHTWDINVSNYLPGSVHTLKAYAVDNSSFPRHGYSDEILFTVGIPPLLTGQFGDPFDLNASIGRDPINPTNGNLYTTIQDFTLPGNGLSVLFTRTYNSQDDYDGPFGYGWTHSYNIQIREREDGSLIEKDEDGTEILFYKRSDNEYIPQAGEHSQVQKQTDGTYIITRKHGIKYHFRPDGKLHCIEDRNGNRVTLEYCTDGLLTRITDTYYRQITFSYDTDGRITTIRLPGENSLFYIYDQEGNLQEVHDNQGRLFSYLYGIAHNLTEIIDANGNSTYFTHGENHRVQTTGNEEGNYQLTFKYQPASLTTTVTDSKGQETSYRYNHYGTVTEIIDNNQNHTLFGWDSNLNCTSVTNANNNITYFSYDARGNLISVIDSLGRQTTFDYHPDYDFVTRIIEPRGYISTYQYDGYGNLIKMIDAAENVTYFGYDKRGNLITLSDPAGNKSKYEYDNYGNMSRITNTAGYTVTYNYDLLGNLISTTDALSNTTTHQYDCRNRLVEIRYPNQSTTSYLYDNNGNCLSITDGGGYSTSFTYDCVNRLSSVKDTAGNITRYYYDTEGNCTALVDANSNCTYFSYNNLNQLIKISNPLGEEKQFDYDAIGNMSQIIKADGTIINYEYDVIGQLTRINYPDTSAISFCYDSNGNRTTVTCPYGTTTYHYDELNQVIQVDGPDESDRLTYVYDNRGNRTRSINHNGEITAYDYDQLGRITGTTSAQGLTTNYDYDASDNLIRKSYPNGTYTNYTYDNRNRLTGLINYVSTDKILNSYQYEHNPRGLKSKVTLATGEYLTYLYDRAGRLSSETKFSPSRNKIYQFNYLYDPVGNRLRMERKFYDSTGKLLPETVTAEYYYNKYNQLLTMKEKSYLDTGRRRRGISRGRAIYSSHITTYTYDSAGNLATQSNNEGTTYYECNEAGRLIHITYPDGNETGYQYDGLGRRIREIESGGGTHYTYDGLNVITEKDENGKVLAEYTRGLSVYGRLGGIISTRQGDNNYFFHYQDPGHVTALTDQNGNCINQYTYDVFGILLDSKETIPNHYRFAAKEYEAKTGFSYFGARYYYPALGRFTTADPLPFMAPPGKEGINLYTYALNDPVNFVDYWGYKRGDIILYRRNSGLSPLIRTVTGGPYSHAAMDIGGGMMIEAVFEGVRITPIDYTHADIFEIKGTTSGQINRMIEYGRTINQKGAGYDFLNFLTLGFIDIESRYICSELVADMVRAGTGAPLVAMDNFITPVDIGRSPRLRPVRK